MMDFMLIVLSFLSLFLTKVCKASSSLAIGSTTAISPTHSGLEQPTIPPFNLPIPGPDVDKFTRDEINGSRAEEFEERRSGTSASAITVPFLDERRDPYFQVLIGCTSVLIISESGTWISHFWESPSIGGLDHIFQKLVIDPIEKGDGKHMPSPFPLRAPGGVLSPNTNPEILIFSPKDEFTGILLYEKRIRLIERTFTGPGKPFEGVQTNTWTYIRQTDPDNEKALGKILVQYSPSQVDDPENPPSEQESIYIVWFEGRPILERRWVASGAQRLPNNYPISSSGMRSHTVTSISDHNANPRMRISDHDGLYIWHDFCQNHNTHEECKTAKSGSSSLPVGFETAWLFPTGSGTTVVDDVERSYWADSDPSCDASWTFSEEATGDRTSTVARVSSIGYTHSSRNSSNSFTAPSSSLSTVTLRVSGWIRPSEPTMGWQKFLVLLVDCL